MLRSIYASGQHTDTAGGGCRSSFLSSFRGSADGYKHKGLLLRCCDPVQRVRFASLNIASRVIEWSKQRQKPCGVGVFSIEKMPGVDDFPNARWTVFLMQNRAVFVDSDAISKAQSRGQGTKCGGFGLYGRSIRLSDGVRLLGCISRAKLGRLLWPFTGLWRCVCEYCNTIKKKRPRKALRLSVVLKVPFL